MFRHGPMIKFRQKSHMDRFQARIQVLLVTRQRMVRDPLNWKFCCHLSLPSNPLTIAFVLPRVGNTKGAVADQQLYICPTRPIQIRKCQLRTEVSLFALISPSAIKVLPASPLNGRSSRLCLLQPHCLQVRQTTQPIGFPQSPRMTMQAIFGLRLYWRPYTFFFPS